MPIVSALVFSMHNGKLVGPVDGFASADWDYIRQIAVERTIAIRSQGFVHPATLVPDELEYAEGYRARMNVLWSKMRPILGPKIQQPHMQKQQPQMQKQQKPQQVKAQPSAPKTAQKPQQTQTTKAIKKIKKPRQVKAPAPKTEEKKPQ